MTTIDARTRGMLALNEWSALRRLYKEVRRTRDYLRDGNLIVDDAERSDAEAQLSVALHMIEGAGRICKAESERHLVTTPEEPQ